jgi:hypothetical protein
MLDHGPARPKPASPVAPVTPTGRVRRLPGAPRTA